MSSKTSNLLHLYSALQYVKLYHSSFESFQIGRASIIFILKLGNESS